MSATEDITADELDASQAVFNHDVAEVLRSQPNDPLGAIFGVDEKVVELTKSVSERLDMISGDKLELASTEVSIFSAASLIALEEDSIARFSILGDEEQLVACMLFNNSFASELIYRTLTGKAPSDADPQPILHPAENAILRVICDQIMTSCFEVLDTLADYGFPKKPEFVDMKQLAAITRANELVKLGFAIGEESMTSEFQILLPIAVFDDMRPEAESSSEVARLSAEQQEWTSRLLDQIEIVEIPLTIEIASGNLPLAHVDSLKVGDKLSLQIDPSSIRLRDSEGHIAFCAAMEVVGQELKFRACRADAAEGG